MVVVNSYQHVADAHPIIRRLNTLDTSDWRATEALIEAALEEGITPWSNPRFLAALHQVILNYVLRPELHQKFLRGVVWARFMAQSMPAGIDDEIRSDFECLGRGEPLPSFGSGLDFGSTRTHKSPQCSWPRPDLCFGFMHSPGQPWQWQVAKLREAGQNRAIGIRLKYAKLKFDLTSDVH